jgi:hypothetical protein
MGRLTEQGLEFQPASQPVDYIAATVGTIIFWQGHPIASIASCQVSSALGLAKGSFSSRLAGFKVYQRLRQQLKWVPLCTGCLTRAKINRPVSSAVSDIPVLEISYLGCKAENTSPNELAECGGSGRSDEWLVKWIGSDNRLWSCEPSGWLWSAGSQWCSVQIDIHGCKWTIKGVRTGQVTVVSVPPLTNLVLLIDYEPNSRDTSNKQSKQSNCCLCG